MKKQILSCFNSEAKPVLLQQYQRIRYRMFPFRADIATGNRFSFSMKIMTKCSSAATFQQCVETP